MVMPQALIEQRPDVVKAWLEAELDAELFFGDSKNAMDIAKMAAGQTTGFPEKALWASAFGTTSKVRGRHRYAHYSCLRIYAGSDGSDSESVDSFSSRSKASMRKSVPMR